MLIAGPRGHYLRATSTKLGFVAQKARVRGADVESETRRAQIVTRDAMISSDSVTYESDSLENIVQCRSFTTKGAEFLSLFFLFFFFLLFFSGSNENSIQACGSSRTFEQTFLLFNKNIFPTCES